MLLPSHMPCSDCLTHPTAPITPPHGRASLARLAMFIGIETTELFGTSVFLAFWHFPMPSIPSPYPLAAVNTHTLIDPGCFCREPQFCVDRPWGSAGYCHPVPPTDRHSLQWATGHAPRPCATGGGCPSQRRGLHAGEAPLWNGARDGEMDSFRAGARPPTAMAHGPMGAAPRRATQSLAGGQTPSLLPSLATADSSLQTPGNDERQGVWREESELRPSQPAVVVGST
jgi:hypothetical protein